VSTIVILLVLAGLALFFSASLRDRASVELTATVGRLRARLGLTTARSIQRRIIRRAMDRSVRSISRTYAPTEIVVGLHPSEMEVLRPLEAALCREIEEVFNDEARARGFELLASPRVRIKADENVQPGTERLLANVSAATLQLTEIDDRTRPLSDGSDQGFLLGVGDRSYRLSGQMIVGRVADVHIRLSDDRISRRHARFTAKGGTVYLEDLGSANGTFVNGQRLEGPTQLKHGDRIVFARRVHARLAADESTAPIAARAG
jgi:FHA domain-containing protein